MYSLVPWILITIDILILINIQLAYVLLEGKWQSLEASMGSLRASHFKWTPIFILYQIARYVNKLNTLDMPRSLTKFSLIFLRIEWEIEDCIILLASITGHWPAMPRHWITSTEWGHLIYGLYLWLSCFYFIKDIDGRYKQKACLSNL